MRAWVEAWGDEVAAVDLVTARGRFAAQVVAFGTYADVVHGREALEAEQWANIWPAIEDFRFDGAAMEVLVSPDRLQAVAVAPWGSTGIAEDGSRFDRPGRATIVVQRASVDDPWLGVHTHFSLGRGVPQATFGPSRGQPAVGGAGPA